jgi:hypothetical protein
MGEGFNNLKRSGYAKFAYLVRLKPHQIMSAEFYLSGIRLKKAGHQAKQRGFTGTVGSDESQYFTLIDMKRDIGYGFQAVK